MCDVFEISLKNGFYDIKNYLEYFSGMYHVARLPFDISIEMDGKIAEVYRVLEDGGKSWIGTVNVETYGIESASVRIFRLLFRGVSRLPAINECGLVFKIDLIKFILSNSYSDVWVSTDGDRLLRESDLSVDSAKDVAFDLNSINVTWNTPLGDSTKSYVLFRRDFGATHSVSVLLDRFLEQLS